MVGKEIKELYRWMLVHKQSPISVERIHDHGNTVKITFQRADLWKPYFVIALQPGYCSWMGGEVIE